jgi:hypothetical protein
VGAESSCTSRGQDPRRSSREEREKEREIGGVGACALQRRASARARARDGRVAGHSSPGETERESEGRDRTRVGGRPVGCTDIQRLLTSVVRPTGCP